MDKQDNQNPLFRAQRTMINTMPVFLPTYKGMCAENKIKDISLVKRCRKACSWVVLGGVSTQALRLVRILVLTPFFPPDQMGIWFLMVAIYGFLQEISDTGIRQALIQNRRGTETAYLHNAWLINLARNLILIVILFFGAPLIAAAFARNFNPVQLQEILQVSCLILLFDGLSSVSMVLLRKQLIFKPVALAQVLANLVGLAAGLLLSWLTQSIKGLVWGEVICAALLCAFSYAIHPYRPRLKWNGPAARELFGYGAIAYLVTLVDAVGTRLDLLLLGMIALGGNDVGLYGLSMSLIIGPSFILSQLSISVGFPALSLVQKDMARVKRGAAEMIKATQLIALPMFGVIFLLAPDLVGILPEKYAGVGVAWRWLSLTGFSLVFLRQLTAPLYAINRVYWCVIRGILHIVLMLLLFAPMYERWGLVGACWATGMTMAITTLFIGWVLLRELQWPLGQCWQDLSPLWRPITGGLLAMALMTAAMLAAGLNWSSGWPVRIAVTLFGTAVYAICCFRYYYMPLRKAHRLALS